MAFNLMNWQNPNPQMSGLLGQYYDPAKARRQALWKGLQQAGIGLLSQGPSKYPIGIGDTIATAFKGGIEGAQQGQQDYMQQSLAAQQMAQEQQDRQWRQEDRLYDRNRDSRQDAWTAQQQARTKQGWGREDQERARMEEWYKSLPPDQQSLAAADPEAYYKQYLERQFSTSSAPDLETLYDENGMEYKARWNPQTNSYERVGGNKATTGMSIVSDGNGGFTFQQGGGFKPLTESQSKDTNFAVRAEGAAPLVDKYGDALTSYGESVGGNMPYGLGNYLKSDEYQMAEQAGNEFLSALLRKDSGATITPEEQSLYGRIFLPKPGDGKDVLAQKKAARARAIAGINAGLPPTAIAAKEMALAKESPIGKDEPVSDISRRTSSGQPDMETPNGPRDMEWNDVPEGRLVVDAEGNYFRKINGQMVPAQPPGQ